MPREEPCVHCPDHERMEQTMNTHIRSHMTQFWSTIGVLVGAIGLLLTLLLQWQARLDAMNERVIRTDQTIQEAVRNGKL